MSTARQALVRTYSRMYNLYSQSMASVRSRFVLAGLGGVVWLAVNLLLYQLLGVAGLFVGTAFCIALLILSVVGVQADLKNLIDKRMFDERNHQALLGIYSAISPNYPLPYFRNAALSADTCLEYIRLIRQKKPQMIVELGSGTSTVVAAYVLKQLGSGQVVALDHETKWGELTRATLADHGLSKQAEVRIAELKTRTYDGRDYDWYDLETLDDIHRIDILLIDGPPDHYGFGLRYPALPALSARLSKGGCIIVDDCIMPRWNAIVVDWARKNQFLVTRLYLNEKAALLLQRQ